MIANHYLGFRGRTLHVTVCLSFSNLRFLEWQCSDWLLSSPWVPESDASLHFRQLKIVIWWEPLLSITHVRFRQTSLQCHLTHFEYSCDIAVDAFTDNFSRTIVHWVEVCSRLYLFCFHSSALLYSSARGLWFMQAKTKVIGLANSYVSHGSWLLGLGLGLAMPLQRSDCVSCPWHGLGKCRPGGTGLVSWVMTRPKFGPTKGFLSHNCFNRALAAIKL